MQVVNLKVQGMTCQGCVRSVKKVLEGVPGVEHADVSLERAEAQVRFDPATANPGLLAQAVRDAGYEAQA